MSSPTFNFDDSFARELPMLYAAARPEPVATPRLVWFNTTLADELGLPTQAMDQATLANVFAGNTLPADATPLAQAYAGHQFGQFVPSLGDGRALLWGELIDRHGRRRDLAFKGSGRTPFSRGGDGKAAMGPMLREVLIGEAMHALGIPTTRALAVVATGQPVRRERVLPGALLTRVAASHLRVGTFQYLAAQGDAAGIGRLVDYTLRRHAPELLDASDRALALLERVVQWQATLIAAWMNVGFIHGVMNTDNMAISGESIDYGPCAFMDSYDPMTVFSSIDRQGRYAYGNQPGIAQWNLARFAEAVLVIHGDDADARLPDYSAAIAAFARLYPHALLAGQRRKFGLQDDTVAEAEHDATLASDWLALLAEQAVDHTLAWRRLADAAEGNPAALVGLFSDRSGLDDWLLRWRQRCVSEDARRAVDAITASASRAARMRAVNPRIIPRNHQVEAALTAASDDGDYTLFLSLLAALRKPFDDDPATAVFAAPPSPEFTANYRTFCGT